MIPLSSIQSRYFELLYSLPQLLLYPDILGRDGWRMIIAALALGYDEAAAFYMPPFSPSEIDTLGDNIVYGLAPTNPISLRIMDQMGIPSEPDGPVAPPDWPSGPLPLQRYVDQMLRDGDPIIPILNLTSSTSEFIWTYDWLVGLSDEIFRITSEDDLPIEGKISPLEIPILRATEWGIQPPIWPIEDVGDPSLYHPSPIYIPLEEAIPKMRTAAQILHDFVAGGGILRQDVIRSVYLDVFGAYIESP